MTPQLRQHLSCSIVASLRPVSKDATALPVDFTFSVPGVGLDLVVSALLSKEVFTESKDPQRVVMDLGKSSLHNAFAVILKGAKIPRLDAAGEGDDAPIPVSLDADPRDARIAELESRVAELTTQYDALVLGRLGILHDPR